MGAGTEGKINKMAEGQMRIADSDITQKASNITYQSSNITRMGALDSGALGDVGRYEMAESSIE